MFRKPKSAGKNKARFRKKTKDDDEGEGSDGGGGGGRGEESTMGTTDLLEQIRREKEGAPGKKKRRVPDDDERDGGGGDAAQSKPKKVMHEFGTTEDRLTASDLATRTAEHHPSNISRGADAVPAAPGDKGDGDDQADGSYKGQSQGKRNKFLAGPIKAPSFVRTTCRFDYQPDICKDYKDTGFCGFGDTCIYLHDRGDTMTGWQLEQQWEERKKKEREEKEREMDKFLASANAAGGGAGDGGVDGDRDNDGGGDAAATAEDGLPFACHICRNPFDEPVVTTCGHYFCQKCILGKVRDGDGGCPICGKDTHGVFNHPTKLVSKKRRLVGSKATWEEFSEAARKK